MAFTFKGLPLKVKAVFRAITKAPRIRDRSVVRTLGDAVDEIFLFRIAAEIDEGQHDDREARGRPRLRGRGAAARCMALRREVERVDSHRAGDVLQALLADIDEPLLETVAHLLVGRPRKAEAAGLADTFEPRRNIDSIAHEVAVAFLDHVPDVHAHSEDDPASLRHVRVALNHSALNRYGAPNRVDGAAIFDERAIACPLDDAPVVVRDRGVDESRAQFAQPGKCAVLVRADEPAVADHVGDQNCRKFAGLAHSAPLGDRQNSSNANSGLLVSDAIGANPGRGPLHVIPGLVPAPRWSRGKRPLPFLALPVLWTETTGRWRSVTGPFHPKANRQFPLRIPSLEARRGSPTRARQSVSKSPIGSQRSPLKRPSWNCRMGR